MLRGSGTGWALRSCARRRGRRPAAGETRWPGRGDLDAAEQILRAQADACELADPGVMADPLTREGGSREVERSRWFGSLTDGPHRAGVHTPREPSRCLEQQGES